MNTIFRLALALVFLVACKPSGPELLGASQLTPSDSGIPWILGGHMLASAIGPTDAGQVCTSNDAGTCTWTVPASTSFGVDLAAVDGGQNVIGLQGIALSDASAPSRSVIYKGSSSWQYSTGPSSTGDYPCATDAGTIAFCTAVSYPTPGGWITAENSDLADAGSHAYDAGDGTVTVTNANWLAINTANTTTAMTCAQNVGCKILPSSSTFWGTSSQTAPTLVEHLSAVYSSFTGTTPVRFWIHWTAQNFTATGDTAGIWFGSDGSTTSSGVKYLSLNFLALEGYPAGSANPGAGVFADIRGVTGTNLQGNDQVNTNSTDDVVVLHMPLGLTGGMGVVFTGAWSGGWPSMQAMRPRFVARTTSTQAFADGTWVLADATHYYAGFTAWRNSSSTALSMTFHDWKWEYKAE